MLAGEPFGSNVDTEGRKSQCKLCYLGTIVAVRFTNENATYQFLFKTISFLQLKGLWNLITEHLEWKICRRNYRKMPQFYDCKWMFSLINDFSSFLKHLAHQVLAPLQINSFIFFFEMLKLVKWKSHEKWLKKSAGILNIAKPPNNGYFVSANLTVLRRCPLFGG